MKTNNQKGSILLIILLLLAGAGLVFVGYKYALKSNSQKTITPTARPIVTIEPTTVRISIYNWKEYTNEKLGYTFKYPTNWEIISPQDNGHINIQNQPTNNTEELGNFTVGINKQITFPVKDWVEKEIVNLKNRKPEEGPYVPPKYIKETTLLNLPATEIVTYGSTGLDTGKYINYILKRNNQAFVISFEIIGKYNSVDEYNQANPPSLKIYNRIISTFTLTTLNETAHWGTYSDSVAKFSITYPPYWKVWTTQTTTYIDPNTNKPLYTGQFTLSGKEGEINIVFGEGFGGGKCSSFGGELETNKLGQNTLSTCNINGKRRGGCGDCLVMVKDLTSFILNYKPTSETYKSLITQILSTFKFTD